MTGRRSNALSIRSRVLALAAVLLSMHGMALAGTIIGLIATALILRSILASLRDITRALDTIERGRLHMDLPAFGRGELGAIGRALYRLRDLLRERAELAAETARQERIRAEAIATLEIGFALFGTRDELLICNPAFADLHDGMTRPIRPGLRFRELQRRARLPVIRSVLYRRTRLNHLSDKPGPPQ